MTVKRRGIAWVLAALLCVMGGVRVYAAYSPAPSSSPSAALNYFSSYNEPITREGFCYLVVSLMAELDGTTVEELYNRLTDTQKEEAFDDVTEENKYISLAKKYELVVGSGVRSFSPQANAERQEIASILCNFIQKKAPKHWDSTKDYTEGVTIEDHVEVADWAMQAVGYLVQCGLMSVDEHENFDPTGTMTVEDAVLLVSQFRLYLESDPETEPVVPTYVWVACGVVAGAVVLAVVIVLLVRRSRRNKAAKAAAELRQEEALRRRLAPNTPGGSPTPPPVPPFAPGTPPDGGTVLLQPEVRPVVPRVRLTAPPIRLDQVFELRVPLTIGRLEDNVLRLNNRTVSGHHCRLRGEGRSVVLEVTGARNPVRLRRGRTEQTLAQGTPPVPLQNGDVLCLGDLPVRVTLLLE